MTDKKISDYLSPVEVLAQMAEEAAELAQAALKLRRALDGTNPTPRSVDECRAALCEEYADVIVCASVLDQADPDLFSGICNHTNQKLDRWLTRLQEAHRDRAL